MTTTNPEIETPGTEEEVPDTWESEGGSVDPFSSEHAPAVQLVVQMRIYDVLMAIYTSIDKDGAARLYELHENGKILGSLPYLDL